MCLRTRASSSVLAVALAAAAAGCVKGTPATTAHPASPARSAAPQEATSLQGQALQLVGKVKLEADGVRGGSIISNNGGTLISNNGGSLVSDNGGGLLSNNGSSLVANASARLRTLAQVAGDEALLADALVEVRDATGAPVLDEQGHAITATTDRTGSYRVTAKLPAKNLVLAVKLYQGGELTALLPVNGSGQRVQGIDTSTTLGATYVLKQYVKGSQATLDKLPAAQAQRLEAGMATARALIDHPPAYRADEVLALASKLRGQDAGLSRTLDDIQALLLGQAHLGEGRPATQVPLYGISGLQVDPQGNLLMIESVFGRIRQVAPDGTMTTLADALRGRIARNFPKATDLVAGPDGALYVSTRTLVQRIKPGGQIDTLAGSDDLTGTATNSFAPGRLALAPDGTLYLVNQPHATGASAATAPRVLAWREGHALEPVPVEAHWQPTSTLAALAVGKRGELYLVNQRADGTPATLQRYEAGSTTLLASDLNLAPNVTVGLGLDASGTLYLSETAAGRVLAFAPDGTRHVAAGVGAAAGATEVEAPGSLAVKPDGTLLIAQVFKNVVLALPPGGRLTSFAGTGNVQGSDAGELALDGPNAGAFDATGRLLISESGGYRVAAYAHGALTTFAGGRAGANGDGGPAQLAGLFAPQGVAAGPLGVYISTPAAEVLREVTPDGTISTPVGHLDPSGAVPAYPQPIDARERPLASLFVTRAQATAVAPDGRLYWASSDTRQVYRLATDGHVELVAGAPWQPTGTDGFLTAIGPEHERTQPATEIRLSLPSGLAFGPHGELYLSDFHSMLVYKLTGLDGASATIERFAGHSSFDIFAPGAAEASPGFDGPIFLPTSVACDATGAVYVAELGTLGVPYFSALSNDALSSAASTLGLSYARVRKFGPDGHVTSIAGPGGLLFTDPRADDGLVVPSGLALAPDGRLAIFDPGANLVHLVPASYLK